MSVRTEEDRVANFMRILDGRNEGPHNAVNWGDIHPTHPDGELDWSLDDLEPAVVPDVWSSLHLDFDRVREASTAIGIELPGDLVGVFKVALDALGGHFSSDEMEKV